MEQSLADLLTDAFSDDDVVTETSVPLFPDGDLDFENLNFDEKLGVDETGIAHENLPTKEDESLNEEATGRSTEALSDMETEDIYMAENVDEEQSDEEDFQGVGDKSMDKTPEDKEEEEDEEEEEEEEDYTSSDGESEQEGSVSGEDEEDEEQDLGIGEESGELLMSVHCGDGFCDGTKEDRIFAEGQPLAPEGAENPQVRNEEQGDRESDEEVSYFERVPERSSVMMIKDDGIEEDEEESKEEKQEDSFDSECEGMKIEQEENVLARCFESETENPCRDCTTKASLEFPEISVQNLQDLIAEVDSEECVEKMKDFSGEEHQEAGESFADYPSDFSSYEYVEDGGKNKKSDHQSTAKQDACPERAVIDITWMRRTEETAEEGDEYLYSIDLEVDADKFRGLDVATEEKDREKTEFVKAGLAYAVVTGSDDGGETSESDSYSSDDDEVQVKRRYEELVENMCQQDLESNKQLEGLHGGSSAAFAGWSTSDDYNGADFNINWNLDVLTSKTTEDTDRAETLSSDVTLHPAEAINTYSMLQRGDATNTSPSNQGSLDDSFFFNTEPEASGSSELGQLGDDEYEDERNWEQEKKRIKAFYEFYDDSEGENDREGRQTKVQFCTDPLSQVIHYETDSSDRDSLSSSTDGEEDLSSTETFKELKEPDDTMQMQPVCEPPYDTQLPENVPDPCKTQNCTRKHKCLNMLKLTLNMGVVIGMGLVMLWFATDQADWFSQITFF